MISRKHKISLSPVFLLSLIVLASLALAACSQPTDQTPVPPEPTQTAVEALPTPVPTEEPTEELSDGPAETSEEPTDEPTETSEAPTEEPTEEPTTTPTADVPLPYWCNLTEQSTIDDQPGTVTFLIEDHMFTLTWQTETQPGETWVRLAGDLKIGICHNGTHEMPAGNGTIRVCNVTTGNEPNAQWVEVNTWNGIGRFTADFYTVQSIVEPIPGECDDIELTGDNGIAWVQWISEPLTDNNPSQGSMTYAVSWRIESWTSPEGVTYVMSGSD